MRLDIGLSSVRDKEIHTLAQVPPVTKWFARRAYAACRNLGFVLAVKRMKVRRWMIVPVHANEDSEEFAN
jgi:hypothetical protein